MLIHGGFYLHLQSYKKVTLTEAAWVEKREKGTLCELFPELLHLVEHCFWMRETSTNWWGKTMVLDCNDHKLNNIQMDLYCSLILVWPLTGAFMLILGLLCTKFWSP